MQEYVLKHSWMWFSHRITMHRSDGHMDCLPMTRSPDPENFRKACRWFTKSLTGSHVQRHLDQCFESIVKDWKQTTLSKMFYAWNAFTKTEQWLDCCRSDVADRMYRWKLKWMVFAAWKTPINVWHPTMHHTAMVTPCWCVWQAPERLTRFSICTRRMQMWSHPSAYSIDTPECLTKLFIFYVAMVTPCYSSWIWETDFVRQPASV